MVERSKESETVQDSINEDRMKVSKCVPGLIAFTVDMRKVAVIDNGCSHVHDTQSDRMPYHDSNLWLDPSLLYLFSIEESGGSSSLMKHNSGVLLEFEPNLDTEVSKHFAYSGR